MTTESTSADDVADAILNFRVAVGFGEGQCLTREMPTGVDQALTPLVCAVIRSPSRVSNMFMCIVGIFVASNQVFSRLQVCLTRLDICSTCTPSRALNAEHTITLTSDDDQHNDDDHHGHQCVNDDGNDHFDDHQCERR